MIARLSGRRAAALALAAAALAALLFLCLVGASRGAAITTYTVTSLEDDTLAGGCEPSEGCTLREALNAISDEEEEDARYRVVFAVEGTIELEGQLLLRPNAEGVKVEVVGPGVSNLTLDGGENERVMTAHEVERLTMSGLTVTGGLESGLPTLGDGGGGILALETNLTLKHVRVTANEVQGDREGGGIAIEELSTLTLFDSEVDHNVSESEPGGGIYADQDCTVTVVESTIEDNEAQEAAGGGIYVELEDATISGSTIRNNHADGGGGGIWLGGGGWFQLEIQSSLVEGNTSTTSGGGIKTEEAKLVVNKSTVTGNTAENSGGGLFITGTAMVEESTISANTVNASGYGGAGIAVDTGEAVEVVTSTIAENRGGAFADTHGPARIRNSTIVGNTAPAGSSSGGVHGAEIALHSTILYGNTLGGAPSDCEGPTMSEGFNLLGSEVGCAWSGASGDRVGEDPLLAPLGDYGGVTETMPPASRESPAINHGEDPEPTDQRGLTRPVPAGASNTDIGAVEVQAPLARTPAAVVPSQNLEAGQMLTCEPGEWDLDTIGEASYSYAWIADPAGAHEQVGTGDALTLDAALAGRQVVCEVSVDNGATVTSVETEPVELEPASASFSPGSLDFGGRRIGSGPSAAQEITVAASGGVPLEVTSVESNDPAEFVVDASACTAKPLSHASCEISVVFEPETRAPVVAEVQIHTTGGDKVVQVTGTGTEAIFQAAPASLSYAPTEVGDASASQEVVVTNLGNETLSVAQVRLAGANPGDFRIEADGCASAHLDEGASCAVEVAFAPGAVGARSAQLVVEGNATGSVGLSGTGIAPGLAATPSSLDFGAQAVDGGAGAPQTLVLSNPGAAPTRIDAIAIEGPNASDFSFVDNECQAGQLAPGAECRLRIVFDPAAAGDRSATLVVSGELAASVPLAGVGTEPEPEAPAPRLRFNRGKGPLAVSKGGKVRPSFTCVSSGRACEARLALLRAPGAGAGVPSRLGSAKVKLAAGKSRALSIPLNKAARRALGARNRLPAILSIEASGASTRADVSLRATAPKAP